MRYLKEDSEEKKLKKAIELNLKKKKYIKSFMQANKKRIENSKKNYIFCMGFETTSHSTSKKPVTFSKCLKQKDRNDCPKQYEEGNGSEAGAVWVLHFFLKLAMYVAACCALFFTI